MGTTAGAYSYENSSLKFINHTEGYIEPDGGGGYNYVYQYKDHLGNVRLSYSDANADGAVDNTEIVEEANYYPFGLKHRGYNDVVNGMPNKFLTYNGKEFEESLGLNLYEMDFRQYDPALGRFNTIDPVTHHSMSPYVAFDNNPIFWKDPSGADSEDPIENTITTIHSYVDKSNVTHIVQTTTTTTTTTNEDGSVSVTYSSASITNTVDAYGNIKKGKTVTISSGTIHRDAEGSVSSSPVENSTKEANSKDAKSALGEWTNIVSEYNKNNDGIYNIDMINKTSKYTTNAARAGVAVLSIFSGLDEKVAKVLEKVLGKRLSKNIGKTGVPISADGVVTRAGKALNEKVGKNNNYMILYGVEHIQNGSLIKQMRTPYGSVRKRVGPTSWQDLWKGIKNIFN